MKINKAKTKILIFSHNEESQTRILDVGTKYRMAVVASRINQTKH